MKIYIPIIFIVGVAGAILIALQFVKEPIEEPVFGGGVEFSDSFTISGGDINLDAHTGTEIGSGWTEVWSDSADIYIEASFDFAYCNGGISDGSVYTIDDTPSGADYIVQATYAASDSGDDAATLICRWQDSSNYYAVSWISDNAYLRKVVSGSATGLDTDNGIAGGSVVELICDGDSITVEDDGVEIMSATDSDISATGKPAIGFGTAPSWCSTCDCDLQALDDYIVTTLGTAVEADITPPIQIIIID